MNDNDIENEDKTMDVINPGNDWISDIKWKELLDIEKLKNFEGFINSFIKSIREWRRWFNYLQVENLVFPDEWEYNLNSFQKLIIIKILRPDRLNKAIENFIFSNMSYNDIEVEYMNFEYILRPSKKNIEPLIIIYKPNYDPFEYIYKYALDNNQKLKNITLTNYNINYIYNYLRVAMKEGHVLYITNLHNSNENLLKLTKLIEDILNSNTKYIFNTSDDINVEEKYEIKTMNISREDEYKHKENVHRKINEEEIVLDKNVDDDINNNEIVNEKDREYNEAFSTLDNNKKIYNTLIDEKYNTMMIKNCLKKRNKFITVHPKFRLFLSTLPGKEIPISLLQKSIIVILEEPHNIKKSISILFKEHWALEENKNVQSYKFRKLLLSLFWFHSILNNRKKFDNLGWNNEEYFFSNKDVILSKYITKIFFNKGVKEIHWPYYYFYICDIIYGSKMDDYFDKKLLNVYAKVFFNNNIFKGKYIFSSSTNYYLPIDVNNEKLLNNYLKEIPYNDSVELFGQKPYAEISYNTGASEEIISLLFCVNSLSLNQYHFHNKNNININEKLVYYFTKKLLLNMPREIYVDELMKKQYNPEQYIYANLLFKEVNKHNIILKKIRSSLNKVQYGNYYIKIKNY